MQPISNSSGILPQPSTLNVYPKEHDRDNIAMDQPMSPPKRITRARAARAGDAVVAKGTRTGVAVTKAKTTRSSATASTASASTKRKTRADEAEEGEDNADELAQPEPVAKTRTRGRPKKILEPEPAAPAPIRATRGRPKKTETTSTSKEETPAPVAKPVTRTTRTTRKTATQPEVATEAEAEKKPVTRTRSTATAPTKATAAKASAVKKSVKFEEPEKENIAPPEPPKPKRGAAVTKTVEPTATGIRAKPVRRAAVKGGTSTSGARGAATRKTSADSESKQYEKPTPLSPKKVTQLAIHNRATTTTTATARPTDYEESEDELAATEERPLARRAAKISSQAAAAVLKLSSLPRPTPPIQLSEDEKLDIDTTLPNIAQLEQPTLLGSPCRRPPASPWKDSMRTPAKKAADIVPILGQSATRPPPNSMIDFGEAESAAGAQPPQSTFKMSLMASPAKRLGVGSPIKSAPILGFGSTSQQLPGPSPLSKSSLMLSPPKRTGIPLMLSPAKEVGEDMGRFGRTPVTKPTLLATPLHAAGIKFPIANRLDVPQETQEATQGEVGVDDDTAGSPSPTRGGDGAMPFPGRLSAVLPRSADPSLVEGTEQDTIEGDKQEQQEEKVPVREEAAEYEVVPEEELEDPELTETEEDQHQEAQLIDEAPSAVPDDREGEEATAHAEEDKMDLDADFEVIEYVEEVKKADLISSALGRQSALFGLREKDLKPAYDEDSDEDDELNSSGLQQAPATPCPTTTRTPSSRFTGRQSTAKRARNADNFGFTPLAGQLRSWGGQSSPLKTGLPESPGADILAEVTPSASNIPVLSSVSPMKNAFFEEAISGETADTIANRNEADAEGEEVTSENIDTDMAGVLEPEFDDITPSSEDVQLAAEADEMSLSEPGQVEQHNSSHDDTLSEASQEYGDENELPVDPTLLIPPVTPQRDFRPREFHTVTKVPLKPADDSTPRQRAKKRNHSISKLPVSRPTHTLQRNATVISYSPTKQSTSLSEEGGEVKERAKSDEPATPAKSEWSMAATPARTPRRDINPTLLRGAVVFVDVHTSEGADASGVFVELLTQMGARCVKIWGWNPNGSEGSDSKIGITHVVYKDGGKRTLEKVRESDGVVQCVGVSWVLE